MRHMILNFVATRVLALMADVRVAIERGHSTIGTGYAYRGLTATARRFDPVVLPRLHQPAAGPVTGDQPSEGTPSKRWWSPLVSPSFVRSAVGDQTCPCRPLSVRQSRPSADRTRG